MVSGLAPIGLSTYGRLNHLQQTINALRQNLLAPESDLFVFSDAPRPGDELKVAAVRDYLRTVDGFRSVTILERETNNRVYNNRQGMRRLLDEYGRMIFLEEDVVTAPGFLTYMNQALDVYQDNPQVMSVSAYCPPIKIPADYRYDVFFLRRFNAWGFGIWQDRFQLIEMDSAPGCARLLSDRCLCREFARFGDDMLEMVCADARGDIDALDVKAMLSQFFHDRYTVYPVASLTHNTGLDGSGMHSEATHRYSVAVTSGRVDQFVPEVILDQRIIKAYVRFRVPWRKLWGNRLRSFETRIRKSLKRLLPHQRQRME